jgi:MFS family permease
VTTSTATLRRRFLFLRATRWLPTGLLIPVMVLLLLDRGFSLSQIGIAGAAQGVAVLALELPTGGLADALGRRPVLLAATAVDVVAGIGLLVVDTMPVLVVMFLLFGLFRALESGPLDAWYVDAAHADDPEIELETSLAMGGTVTGLAIAAGAMLSGGLVALDPLTDVNPLAVPLVAAVCLRVVDLSALAILMREERPRGGRGELRASVREVPGVVADTLALVRGSVVLAALVSVEFFWGFGMGAFESLAPAKVSEVTDDPESAAALFGPAVTAAWVAAAAGAALVPWLARRMGTATASMALHTMQAMTLVGMAWFAGPVGVVALYVATLATHGALNPLYQTLLHQQADAAHRTTVLSAASMASHPGAAVGGIVLGMLADRASVTTAMVAGALVLLITVPLYLPARRQGLAYVAPS